MTDKAYLSNICAAWPVERQRDLLGPCERTYQDDLGKKAIRNGNPSALKERANMLAPTSRQTPETITVASWRCLAFSAQDLASVIAAAGARNATLVALDTGITIHPNEAGTLVADQIVEFSKVVRRGGKGRSKSEIAAETIAETKRRAALIAEDWPKPSNEFPTAVLLMRAGHKGKPMAPSVARRELGSRPERQRAYQVEINREAGRQAARDRKKGETA